MSEFNISIQKDTRNIRKKPFLVRWVGGWSDVRVLNEFYSKASDANKKKAVEVMDRLMGE